MPGILSEILRVAPGLMRRALGGWWGAPGSLGRLPAVSGFLLDRSGSLPGVPGGLRDAPGWLTPASGSVWAAPGCF